MMQEKDKNSTIKFFKEDDIIIREGELNREMYKIISGSAALYLHYGEENELLIGAAGEQKFLGEVSLLAGKPSPYTAVAIDNVMVMRIAEEQSESFFSENTRNAFEMMKNMANKIVMLNKNLDQITDEFLDTLKKIEKDKDNREFKDITEKIKRYKAMAVTGQNGFSMKI